MIRWYIFYQKRSAGHSETLTNAKSKALVDGLASTLLYVKDVTMHNTLANVEAKALVDELPDVLRDAKTERF